MFGYLCPEKRTWALVARSQATSAGWPGPVRAIGIQRGVESTGEPPRDFPLLFNSLEWHHAGVGARAAPPVG